MSSNDHKKFTTQDKVKQADIDSVSDVMVVPSDTTDYILTVTDGKSNSIITTSTELGVTVPAQTNAISISTIHGPDQYSSWLETTDTVFESHDFSDGLSLFHASSVGFYHAILDATEAIKVEFTDGSYVKIINSGSQNLKLEYRDKTNGAVKSFVTGGSTDISSIAGSVGYDMSSNRYFKAAISFGPIEGYKATAISDHIATANTVTTSSLTAVNGADWDELDFSNKVHSKTMFYRGYATSGSNTTFTSLDVLGVAAKEIYFGTMSPCTHDENDQVRAGGTTGIKDMFSKDYDRVFLFGDGDSDETSPNIVIKSHGDNGAVTLNHKSEYFAGGSTTQVLSVINTPPAQFISSADTVDREIIDIQRTGGSSISGDIDVELEMSPDGENWCPALNREATTQTTAAPAAEGQGNEEGVVLIPTSEQQKSKFALGSLSYDDNGAETTVDAGTRDVLHQHMQVDKPFNFSWWHKTTADNPPSDTHTPVLWRHGGKDLYTNKKAVELTDSTKTQNLSQQITFSNTKLSAGRAQDGNYQARIGDPYQDWTVCMWWTPYNELGGVDANPGPSIEYYSGIRFKVEAGVYIGGNNSRVTLATGWWNLNVSSGVAPYYFTADIAYPYGGANAGNQAEVQNGSFFIAVTNSHDSVTGSTTTKSKIFRSDGVMFYDKTWTFTPSDPQPSISNFLDHPDETMAYSRVLTQAEIEAHFGISPTAKVVDSSGNLTTTPAICPVDPTKLSTFSDAIVYVRGGDADGDSATTMQNLAPSNSHFPASFTGTFTQKDLGTSKGNYLVSNDNQNLFITTSNTSISGWFKTTEDATGTLLSNTEGAAVEGMKLDVNASDMTLSFLDSADSISINSDVNDGNWHHLVITKNDAGTNQFTIYVDGVQVAQASKSITDADLKGANGFTLLGDGQHNINAVSPASTDSSKLNASLSNWSLHSEVLSAEAVSYIYNRGKVRNLKTIPDSASGGVLDTTAIEAYWKLSDTTSPEQDSIGSKDLQYQTPPGEGGNDTAISGPPTYELGGVYKEENNGGLLSPNSTFNDYSATTGTQQTYNCWIYKPSSFSGDITWYGDFMTPPTGSTTAGYGLVSDAAYSRDLVFYHNNGGQYNYVGVGSLPSGYEDEWVMVTIVTDTNTNNIKMYLKSASANNYASPATGSLAGGWTNWSIPKTETITKSGFLGARTWNGSIYPSSSSSLTTATCKIDEFSAFNRALTLTEIEELYDNQDPLTHSRSSDVYRYIRFGNGSGDSESSLVCQVDSNFVLDKSSSASGTTYLTTLTSADAPYTEGPPVPLSSEVVDTTGDMLHKETDQYGSGFTVSLTKRFNFDTSAWGSTSDQATALCLSFNGFEDHAEYFALYKCSQGTGENIEDICNNDWNNVIISFSGNQGGTTTDMVEGQNAVFGTSNYNFTVSYNGQNLASFASAADFVGGLGLNASNATKSFPLYNRHLKFVGTQDEIYQPHCQFNSNIFLPIDDTTNRNIPQDIDSITSFQGYVDESSFHSESWWVNAAGADQTTFSQEKPGTIYGSTSALSDRGVNSNVYGVGKPYPLLDPDVIGASRGTSQWINPYPIGVLQEDGNVSTGGLEGFWRWGDIAGDCSENINDAIGDQEDPKDRHRSLKARNFEATEVVGATQDIINLTTSDSIYISESAVVSAIFQYNPIKIESIVSSVCNIKNIVSPILQYLRVKFKGSGTCDLGDGNVKASIHFRKRRKR